jgi:hypothetical protein
MGGAVRRLMALSCAAGMAASCAASPAALQQLMDARRLASEMHVAFAGAVEASNRAVMADTDDASAAAARTAKASCCAEALAHKARAAVLEIQVLQAPHIAESEDAAMTKLEARMNELAGTARDAIGDLKAPVTAAALERFVGINAESSRCRAATATFVRWPCRSAASA